MRRATHSACLTISIMNRFELKNRLTATAASAFPCHMTVRELSLSEKPEKKLGI